MKKNIINFLLLTTILFVGCKKEDTRYPFSIDLKRVPYVNVVVNPTGSQAIDLLNLAAFAGKYDVTLLYPKDVAPSKVDIVAIKNGNRNVVKVVNAGVTTFPTTFTITAAQLATLFGAPIALGDTYDLGADIYTQDGTKYEAFPLGTGVQAYGGTGQQNQPGFNPVARFAAICAYDPTIYTGNFVVVSDAFQDLNPGTIVVLTQVSANSFSMTYPNPNVAPTSPVPTFTVVVNTGNNNLTVAQKQIGTKIYGTYDNPTVETPSPAGGTVAPCDKTATINIIYRVTQGSFGGPYPLVIKKQ